jgi:hypothetical protein
MKCRFLFLLISFFTVKASAMVCIPEIVVIHSNMYKKKKKKNKPPMVSKIELNKAFSVFLGNTVKESPRFNNDWKRTFDFCGLLIGEYIESLTDHKLDEGAYGSLSTKFSELQRNITITKTIKDRFLCKSCWYKKVAYWIFDYITNTIFGENNSIEYYKTIDFLKLLFVVDYFEIKIIYDLLSTATAIYYRDAIRRNMGQIYDRNRIGNFVVVVLPGEFRKESFAFKAEYFENFWNKMSASIRQRVDKVLQTFERLAEEENFDF